MVEGSRMQFKQITKLFLAFLVCLSLLAGIFGITSSQAIRIIFLHHSCGQNLIDQGSVREGLSALGYQFFDHGYNGDGLRLADGSYTGSNYDVPGDNTDPDGLSELFSQPLTNPPGNAFSQFMQYDVFIFKSCFPASNISSDEMLSDYQRYYLSMRSRMDEFPNKVFIIVTQPPQVPNNTDREEGRRARQFTEWLQSDAYLSGHSNIFVFDFFDLLAGSDNFLRREYRVDEWDAHPNERANAAIGSLFVSFIDQTIRAYSWSQTGPSAQPEKPQTGESPAQPAVSSTVGSIDDFESNNAAWTTYSDGTGSTIECMPDTQYAFSGSHALRVDHKINASGWAGCERGFDGPQDWSAQQGISFLLRAEAAGLPITFTLNMSAPGGTVYPYEVHLLTSNESVSGFVPQSFRWEEFEIPDWGDQAAPAALDPTSVASIAINFGNEQGQQGTFWVDDIALGLGENIAPAPVSQDADEQPAKSMIEEQGRVGGFINRLCPLSTALAPTAFVAGLYLKKRRKPKQ